MATLTASSTVSPICDNLPNFKGFFRASIPIQLLKVYYYPPHFSHWGHDY
jgi:hypothetical protein